MVKIAGKDFNMDMDKYIKDRRSRESSVPGRTLKEKFSDIKDGVNEWKVFSLFKAKKDVYIDDLDDSEEDFSEEEAEIKAIDELEDDLEERREGVLKRFFKKLRFSGKKSEEDDYDDYDEVSSEEEDLDDIKEVIKITHRWLEELPPEALNRFKKSEDFEKYKAVLKRLGMIK